MNKMLLAAICAILSFAGLGGEALQAQQLNGQAKDQAGKELDKTKELVDKASETVKEC